MTGVRRILLNSGWMAAEQIIRLMVGLFLGIWVARHLGPSDFGALNFALSLSSLVGIFGALGLSRIVVRELTLTGADQIGRNKIISTVFACRLAAAVVCFLASYLLSVQASQGVPILVALISFRLVFAAFEVIDLDFQSKSQINKPVIARAIAFAVVSVLKILMLLNGYGVVAFAVLIAAETMLAAGLLVAFYRAEGVQLEIAAADFPLALRLLRESWPEIFAGFACVVFMRIDQIMLGNMLGERAVGVYSVASRIAEAWYFIPTALVTSSFPAIVRLREVDHGLYMRRLHHLMWMITVIAMGAALLTTFAASWAIPLLFGAQYNSSAQILIVLIWSGVFVGLGTASGSWIMAERRPMLNLTRNTLGAASNVLLNLALIPKYGPVGAAVGTLISQAVAYFASDFLSRETRAVGQMKLKSLFLIWK